MRRFPTAVALFATGLASLILASAAPASANSHPVASYRIGNVDLTAFTTASTTSQVVTMEPPSTVAGLQQWTFNETRLGTRVTNAATGGCLGLPDHWITVNLPPVVQQPCKNRSTEYWRIVSTTTDTVIFQNAGYGGCMGLNTTATTMSAQYASNQLFVVPCRNDDRSQHFRLVA
jgi:hypothetical protein